MPYNAPVIQIEHQNVINSNNSIAYKLATGGYGANPVALDASTFVGVPKTLADIATAVNTAILTSANSMNGVIQNQAAANATFEKIFQTPTPAPVNKEVTIQDVINRTSNTLPDTTQVHILPTGPPDTLPGVVFTNPSGTLTSPTPDITPISTPVATPISTPVTTPITTTTSQTGILSTITNNLAGKGAILIGGFAVILLLANSRRSTKKH